MNEHDEAQPGTSDNPLPSEAEMPEDAAPPLDEPSDEPAALGVTRPSVAERAHNWRDELVGTALLTAAIGVWIMLSPEALGYGPGDATANTVVGGALVLVFSIARLITSYRGLAIGVILFALGAWLFVSALLYDAPVGGQYNQASFGAGVALLSIVGLAGAQRGRELNP